LAWYSQDSARSGTPDCSVVHRTVCGELAALRSFWWRTTIIHRTIWWCTGLSGEPTAASATVGRAIRGRRVARANGRQGAPDCLVCTGQCPVRQPARSCNGQHATVTVRWCTGLSGVQPDRRQELPSLLVSNGS
jgi:hypothetical protein